MHSRSGSMSRFNPLLWSRPSVIWRYVIVILSVAAALIIFKSPAFHLQSATVSLFLWAGIARYGALGSRFLLLCPAPSALICCKAGGGDATPCHLYGVGPVCRVAGRRANERPRIA